MIDMYMFISESEHYYVSLSPLVDQKVISITIGMKKSGLQLKHLKAAYDRGSLKAILIEKVNGSQELQLQQG